jgi:hypothetical protein
MSTSTAVSSEVKGVTEIKKEEEVATVTEIKKEEEAAAVAVAVAAVAVDEDEGEGDCDCEECQGGFVEYEEEGGWIDELGVDDHDFY